jgi:hypothetical protein
LGAGGQTFSLAGTVGCVSLSRDFKCIPDIAGLQQKTRWAIDSYYRCFQNCEESALTSA